MHIFESRIQKLLGSETLLPSLSPNSSAIPNLKSWLRVSVSSES